MKRNSRRRPECRTSSGARLASPIRLLKSKPAATDCCAAVSLSVLEAKRLLLLILEMLVDSRAIRFAGALLPVVFSFVDVGVGFPVAVGAFYAIRKQQLRPCRPKIKRTLRRVTVVLAICVIMNAATLVAIGTEMRVSPESFREVFKNSMRLYSRNATYKAAIDELQLDFQCCGFASYMDWFAFDWQGENDAGDREVYGDRSIPFSCCSLRSTLPCAHLGMKKSDVKTINTRGCAVILSRILLKIMVVGYTMTSMIICTQIFLIVFLVRIIRKIFPDLCPTDCNCCEQRHANAGYNNCSSDESSSSPHGPKHQRQPMRSRLKPTPSPVIRKFICRSASDEDEPASPCDEEESPSRSPCATSWSSDNSSSGARLTSSPSCGRTGTRGLPLNQKQWKRGP